MKNPGLLQLFIYCLLKANHEPEKILFNGEEITIERGQFITGRDVLAKELRQNGRTLYDRLKILSQLQIINTKTNNRFTLITVNNYCFYQSATEETNSNTNNKPTTSQQQANTNKNDKNDKNIYTAEFEQFYSEYPRPEDKRRTFNNWKTQLKHYTVEQLMAACRNYKKAKAGTEKQYLKSSANFLGKEKPFEDYIEYRAEPAKSKYRDMTNYQPGE